LSNRCPLLCFCSSSNAYLGHLLMWAWEISWEMRLVTRTDCPRTACSRIRIPKYQTLDVFAEWPVTEAGFWQWCTTVGIYIRLLLDRQHVSSHTAHTCFKKIIAPFHKLRGIKKQTLAQKNGSFWKFSSAHESICSCHRKVISKNLKQKLCAYVSTFHLCTPSFARNQYFLCLV
jgi:hypothetical protein